MNKNKILILILTITIIILGVVYFQKIAYEKVRMGITMKKAEKIINENDDYAILSVEESIYKCESGKYKGKFVALYGEKGTYPDTNCSDVLRWPGENKFLIKIKSVNENFFDDGIYRRDLDITCESYEFIIPIKRQYCYSKHERYFYPENYIDEYDVLNGDYKE